MLVTFQVNHVKTTIRLKRVTGIGDLFSTTFGDFVEDGLHRARILFGIGMFTGATAAATIQLTGVNRLNILESQCSHVDHLLSSDK
jgi:hypothetical protein